MLNTMVQYDFKKEVVDTGVMVKPEVENSYTQKYLQTEGISTI
jgi:hypothetical protein